MKFIESNVFTPLNADQVAVGSKGYFAETLGHLKSCVEQEGPTAELTSIRDEDHGCRFYSKEYKSAWILFYLVETPKLCTYKELTRWLAEGKGEWRSVNGDIGYTSFQYNLKNGDHPVKAGTYEVRRWGDPVWHTPSKKYLGVE